MKILATRGHFAGGKLISAGTVYDAPDGLALELIATGKAQQSTGPARQPRGQAPMTSKSANALVDGKGEDHAR